ncbi:hypothetical protein LTR70_008116 [Exophiala xenobiotica]|uniref:Uncharacterized protein n=1 Tax=Lithohypha guttulata TaxID=1690604 RepID=A0ABR0JYR7_9EURO|nr:hypothetical protein LTR24_009186 [Lithohypha guttulata]KAK5312519.1 hypothetical protein LTR70_008116 [Exophiala xenobiotica]
MTITHILYDLLAYPSYIAPLRAEISAVWNHETNSARHLTRVDLHKLPKLDSFLKESERLSPPPRLIAIDGAVQDHDGLTFSDGLHLPHKTYLASNSYGMSLDRAIYDDLTAFDGLRYYKLRLQRPEQAQRFAYAATDPREYRVWTWTVCVYRAGLGGRVLKLLVAYVAYAV